MIQPSEEEKAEIKRKQDSVLALQIKENEKAKKAVANTEITSQNTEHYTPSPQQKQDGAGTFAPRLTIQLKITTI